MKRMNRKKILLTLLARKNDDKIMEEACKAHHKMLNKQIVELGGEDVEAPLLNY